MKLTQREARLINELRSVPTGKIVAVKYAGEIRAVKVEVDVEASDRARGHAQIWKGIDAEVALEKKTIRISEPQKTLESVETPIETRIQEPTHNPR